MKTSAIVLLGAVTILALVGLATRQPTAPDRGRRAAAQAPIVLGAPRSSATTSNRQTGLSEHDRPVRLRPAPAAATLAARAFLAAFVRWETGHADPATLADLQAASAPGLWATLRSGRGEPHPPDHLSAARLVALASGPAARQAATLVATLRRAHHTTGLAIVMHRGRHGWRVTTVGR